MTLLDDPSPPITSIELAEGAGEKQITMTDVISSWIKSAERAKEDE